MPIRIRCSSLKTLVLVFLTIHSFSGTAFGKSTLVSPSSAWCNIINTASPGDQIILSQGNYPTPCRITARGTPDSPIVVRSESEDPSARAVFTYSGSTSGSTSNVLELRDVAHLVIRGFTFDPTQADIDAIRIRRATDIIIERCIFRGIGGLSVSGNDGSIQRISIRDNVFRNLKTTGIYFGCHDGSSCLAIDLVIERNLIDGVTTPFNSKAVGYGIQVKLNSWAIIKDNTIYNTKGPGIMVYGSNTGNPASLIEGNYVEGSRDEAGIVSGGGPVIVRNNILVGNAYGGISAQDYGGRDLQHRVWIVHNTIIENSNSGINVSSWRPERGNVIAFNAILPSSGTPPIRPASPFGTIIGNETCNDSYFVNSTSAPYDLWPSSDSPLIDGAGTGTEAWRPVDDFMGVARGSAADIGAFERSSFAIDHLVGAKHPRPPRLSWKSLPPSATTNLRLVDQRK
jgi:hypothetical protein